MLGPHTSGNAAHEASGASRVCALDEAFRLGADKRCIYSIARGSAMESAAAVDVVKVRRLAAPQACATVRSLAVRVVQLLTKLDASLA